MHSVSYLTLTAGDKGITCPSASPKQCKKRPSGTPPLATMAILSASHATAHRWLHSLTPRVLARPGERQAFGRDKTTAAARRLPRQATTLYPRSSTSTNVSPWGPFQARVARGCAASGARWHAKLTRLPSWRAVAPLTVPFYFLGDADGHLMPLPLPSGLGREHCAGGCTNRNPFSTFTLLCVATCR